MATTKQREAAKRNVKKAQAGAKRKQTLKNLPSGTRTALGKEAAAVRRGDSPTRKELYAEARKLGIAFSAPADAQLAKNADQWGSFTLGVIDVTPLELASAYATVASEGTYCKPLPVQSITNADGQAVPVASTCTKVLNPDVARAATDAARCPVGQQSAFGKCDGGTATQVDSIMGGRPVAGKTGSTEDNRTETFVGFTRTAVAAGIAADPVTPSDHVGSAVEAQVVTAVGRTLRSAVGSGDYPDFTSPGAEIALGN